VQNGHTQLDEKQNQLNPSYEIKLNNLGSAGNGAVGQRFKLGLDVELRDVAVAISGTPSRSLRASLYSSATASSAACKRGKAGNGNRTRMASLEGWNFTIKLCPREEINCRARSSLPSAFSIARLRLLFLRSTSSY
jgi:hypothetical protein